MKLVKSGAAGRDLDDIFDYTLTTWGIEQAEAYVASFDDAFARLRDHPEIGMTLEFAPRFRRLRHRHHLILYELLPGRLRVVRILHERMDVTRTLS